MNSYYTLRDRLKYLSQEEKQILKNIIYASEDGIKYQELEIRAIPDSPFFVNENSKSKTLDDRLTVIKSYETQIEFF